MLTGRDRSLLVALLLAAALLVAGPSWGSSTALGDGSAEVHVVSPDWLEPGNGSTGHVLTTEDGRFGTRATYLRVPTVVVDASNVSGRPELYYDLDIPAFDRDPAATTQLLTDAGRYRLSPSDLALPPPDYDEGGVSRPEPGLYTARLLVRVQSFSGQRVVVNRTVEVRLAR